MDNILTLEELKTILVNRIDPITLYKIYTQLDKKIIPATDFVKLLLFLLKRDDHFLLFAYALRSGLDPNVYLKINDTTEIHILIYIYFIYNKKEDESYKNTLIIMLLMSGADPLKSYDTKSNINCIKYLESQRINHILGMVPSKNTSSEVIKKCCILLDNDVLLNSLTNDDILKYMVDIIRNRSSKIFDQFVKYEVMNNRMIEYSIKYINIHVFKKLLDNGIYPSYNQINIILLYYTGGGFIKDIFNDFIKELLYHKGSLDNYQKKYYSNVLKLDDKLLLEVIKNCILKKYIKSGKKFGPDERVVIGSTKNKLDVWESEGTILTSDMCEDIMKYRKNPYTSTPLNDKEVEAVNTRRGLLKRLGYKVSSESKDDSESIRVLQEKAFIELIKINCNKDITNITIEKIQRISQSFELNLPVMNSLQLDHYRRTFYISCYEKLRENMELLKYFL